MIDSTFRIVKTCRAVLALIAIHAQVDVVIVNVIIPIHTFTVYRELSIMKNHSLMRHDRRRMLRTRLSNVAFFVGAFILMSRARRSIRQTHVDAVKNNFDSLAEVAANSKSISIS